MNSTEEVENVSNVLSCDRCDYKPASEKGLMQHKRMKHKSSQPKESLRQSEEGPPCRVSASPLLDISREDVVREEEPMYSCDDCEDEFYTGEDLDTHMIEIHKHCCIFNPYTTTACPGCLVP